jgi:hypothetical protein
MLDEANLRCAACDRLLVDARGRVLVPYDRLWCRQRQESGSLGDGSPVTFTFMPQVCTSACAQWVMADPAWSPVSGVPAARISRTWRVAGGFARAELGLVDDEGRELPEVPSLPATP